MGPPWTRGLRSVPLCRGWSSGTRAYGARRGKASGAMRSGGHCDRRGDAPALWRKPAGERTWRTGKQEERGFAGSVPVLLLSRSTSSQPLQPGPPLRIAPAGPLRVDGAPFAQRLGRSLALPASSFFLGPRPTGRPLHRCFLSASSDRTRRRRRAVASGGMGRSSPLRSGAYASLHQALPEPGRCSRSADGHVRECRPRAAPGSFRRQDTSTFRWTARPGLATDLLPPWLRGRDRPRSVGSHGPGLLGPPVHPPDRKKKSRVRDGCGLVAGGLFSSGSWPAPGCSWR